MKTLAFHRLLKWLRLPVALRWRLIEWDWQWRFRHATTAELVAWLAAVRAYREAADR